MVIRNSQAKFHVTRKWPIALKNCYKAASKRLWLFVQHAGIHGYVYIKREKKEYII